MSLHVVILAAGQGTRMRSKTPKVLHKLAGKPMLQHVLETAKKLNPLHIDVIIGHEGERVKAAFADWPVRWVVQETQSGTGHAVLQTLPGIHEDSFVLVLSADVPLIQETTLQALINPSSALRLLTAVVPNPFGLGRIIRDTSGLVEAIVEEKDATSTQKQIHEIYSGICCVKGGALHRWLPKLTPHNAQKEYYLTDIVAMARAEGLSVEAITAVEVNDILGVNDRVQLEAVERLYQKRQVQALMRSGVTVADANRVDIRGELSVEPDTFIDVNTVFEGRVILGRDVTIGAHCVIKNATLGEGTCVLPNSVLEGCDIGPHCQIGPFARIRPGTKLAAQCKIGNFVETKNAIFDEGSKANHLSYLGDTDIGKSVNIGAGTITCNYDGAKKHRTTIKDNVFIGSDTQLVAPVTIGENATIGAGSTIRKDVPPHELTLTESRQKTVSGWKRPKKDRED